MQVRASDPFATVITDDDDHHHSTNAATSPENVPQMLDDRNANHHHHPSTTNFNYDDMANDAEKLDVMKNAPHKTSHFHSDPEKPEEGMISTSEMDETTTSAVEISNAPVESKLKTSEENNGRNYYT